MKKSAKTKFSKHHKLHSLDFYAKEPGKSPVKYILLVAPIFQLISFFVAYSALKKLNLLQKWQFVLVFVIAMILQIITTKAILSNFRGKITKTFAVVFAILLGSLYCIGANYTHKMTDFIEVATGKTNEKQTYSVMVLESSRYEEISQLNTQHIGFLSTNPNLDKTKETLDSVIDFTPREYGELGSLIAAITSYKTSAIVVANSYIEYLEENDNPFLNKSRVIYTFEVLVEQVETGTPVSDLNNEPFIVYISGSDSRGSLQETARSDVNILMVVNPAKAKVLLVSIPRDYYVQLHGTTGTRDKLTHAGVYGIEMSRKTIEDLIGYDINYTVKIGFNSFISVVDALDGVDIDSDKDFIAHTDKSCHIREGKQHLDSRCALAFARERYAYDSGDRHRGQNQQAVITAIINKMSDPRQLTKFTDILEATEGTLETSMSYNEITSFARNQLNTMQHWEVESISLDGYGAMLPTYSMGAQNLYVMVPDETTIYNARKKIEEYLKTE